MSLGVRFDSSQSILHFVQGKYQYLQERYDEAHASLLKAIGSEHELERVGAKESKRRAAEISTTTTTTTTSTAIAEAAFLERNESNDSSAFAPPAFVNGVPFSQLNKRQQRRTLMETKEAREADLDQKLPFEAKKRSGDGKHVLRGTWFLRLFVCFCFFFCNCFLVRSVLSKVFSNSIESINKAAADRILTDDKKQFLRESYLMLARCKQKLGDWKGSVGYLRKRCEYDNEGSSVMELGIL
jgi:hypothetical protein